MSAPDQPTGEADKAREARSFESIVDDFGRIRGDLSEQYAREQCVRQLRAVADAEVEEATRELRAELAVEEDQHRRWGETAIAAERRAEKAEADLTAQRDEWMAALEQWEARAETAEAECDQLHAALARVEALLVQWPKDRATYPEWERYAETAVRLCEDELRAALAQTGAEDHAARRADAAPESGEGR